MQYSELLNTGKSFFTSQSWLGPCESEDRTEVAGVGEARSLEGAGWGGGICTPEDEDTTGLTGAGEGQLGEWPGRSTPSKPPGPQAVTLLHGSHGYQARAGAGPGAGRVRPKPG